MNQITIALIAMACAMAPLTACTTATPVYSDGSYGRPATVRTADIGADEWPELIRPPAQIVQANPRPGDSAMVKGYGYFVRGIQNTAYTAIYLISVPARAFACQ